MNRVFFFDMDGTLYDNEKHQFSDHTEEVFQSLHERNDYLIMISSRSIHEIKHLPPTMKQLPFSLKILEGGALIMDENGEILQEKAIDRQSVETILQACQKENVLCRLSTPTQNICWRQMEPAVRYQFNRLYLCAPTTGEWDGSPVMNVLVWSNDDRFKKELCARLPHCSIVYYPNALEIRAENVSKENALQWVIERLHPSKSYAFGDGMNDLEMLKMADIGVAMGNAVLPVQQAADEICPAVNEGGAPRWIKERILNYEQ